VFDLHATRLRRARKNASAASLNRRLMKENPESMRIAFIAPQRFGDIVGVSSSNAKCTMAHTLDFFRLLTLFIESQRVLGANNFVEELSTGGREFRSKI